MTSFIKSFVMCTMTLCILCGIAAAQPDKPKAAVYIKGNPPGREVLMMAVNTFLIKTGMYQMIAVDAIDLLAQEHIRQRSGSVSDNDIAKLGRDAGAQYVCVVERTEIDGVSYVTTSMVSVQSKIAEFSDMKELPRGEKVISVIERQINAMLGLGSVEEPGGGYDAVSELPSQGKPPLPAVSYLRINGQNEADVSFGSAGGMKTLTVSTDGGGYDITFLPAWCSADKYGESFSLTCSPNQTSLERNDWFNVTSGDKTVKVSIYQSSSGAPSFSNAGKPERASDSRSGKPARERKPKRKKNQGMGFGGVFASDFGGGLAWSDAGGRAELAMPYNGGGFYFFWDWVYLELFGGMHWGGGKWENAAANPGDLPDMPRAYGNYGVFGKFPLIDIGRHIRLFPLYGIDYEASKYDSSSVTPSLKYANWKKDDVPFDGDGGRPPGQALSALWGKFGGGIDIDIANSENNGYFFLRVEALYGIRFKANDFEKYYAAAYIEDGSRYVDATPMPGRGLTVRVSVGFSIGN